MENIKNTIESVKYAVIMRTFDLTPEQFRMLDESLEKFARDNNQLIDKISVNKQIVGVL